MPKAKQSTEDKYVTQSQWAEGMEMIKDFFGKIMEEIQGTKHDISGIKGDISELKKDVSGIKGDILGLKHDVSDLKRDQEEIKKNVEINTQSLALLTEDLRKTEKLENDIFKHDQRITKLEKVR